MTEQVAGVEISKPDKVLFPDDGFTKLDLARYYDALADVMVPHLRGRPVNMQRFPDGVGGMAFYEKKVPSYFPDWVHTVEVHTEDGTQRQVLVADRRSLVYLAQQACITPHTWLCTTSNLEKPDQLVFDLDPSDSDLGKVRRATRMVGELLDDLGLTAYLKTTGIPRLPRARAPPPQPGFRRRAGLRAPVRGPPGRQGPRPAHRRASQGEAGSPRLRRHRPQRLRPDRGPAVRRARPTRCPGLDADQVGGAVAGGPGPAHHHLGAPPARATRGSLGRPPPPPARTRQGTQTAVADQAPLGVNSSGPGGERGQRGYLGA